MAVAIMLLVAVAIVAIVVGVLWAIGRAAASSARSAAGAGPQDDGPRAWSGQTSDEPVIDVAAKDITDDLVKAIQENNRLLREVLDELRRRPGEPPPPPPSSQGHLD
jgi:hypothetical protein